MTKCFCTLPTSPIVSLFAVLLIALVGCSDGSSGLSKTVHIGIAKQPSSALVHIAYEKGFFREEGLNIEVSHFPSGKRALVDGLLTNKVDLITTADIPFVWKSFHHDDLMILASLYTADNVNRIIARKEAGIESFSDLIGKRVATQKQSAVHYFLASVLHKYSIEPESVQLSYSRADELPIQLANNEIDAFSMREPYISQAVDMIGRQNVTILESPGTYIQSELLVAHRAFFEQNENINQALLRALINAEQFTRAHPTKAVEIVANWLGLNTSDLMSIWHTFDLTLNLEPALISRLEQSARWMIRSGMVQEKTVPNFVYRVHDHCLSIVKPQSSKIAQ